MTKTFKDFVEQVKADCGEHPDRIMIKGADPKYPGDEGAIHIDPGGRSQLYSAFDGIIYEYDGNGAHKVCTFDEMHKAVFTTTGAYRR